MSALPVPTLRQVYLGASFRFGETLMLVKRGLPVEAPRFLGHLGRKMAAQMAQEGAIGG